VGKTSKPLYVLTVGLKWEELTALAAQGHTIHDADAVLGGCEYDLILGPTCHRMNEDLRKYLPLALAEARRVKYPKATKESD